MRMESRLFEEVGRGWADTGHTTELQPCFETMQAEFRIEWMSIRSSPPSFEPPSAIDALAEKS